MNESALNFRDFMRLDEIMDIASADTSEIVLKRNRNSYIYDFEHNGEGYKVEMEKSNYPDEDMTEFNPTYVIAFEGPNDMDLTGTAGMSATIIYRAMLLAIKKLLETTEVNSLEFSPAVPRMLPMYDIFYRKYLLPDPPRGQGFVRVRPTLYVRRSHLEDKMNQKVAGDQEVFRQKMANAERKVKARIDEMDEIRKKKRFIDRTINPIDSGFYYWITLKPGTPNLPGGEVNHPALIAVNRNKTDRWAYDDSIRQNGIYLRDNNGKFIEVMNNWPMSLVWIKEFIRPATEEEIRSVKAILRS
jgi:hypothetical protein